MKTHPKIGDIQTDTDKTEWVVVGVGHLGLSRVRRNSLAHRVHAQRSEDIAKSLVIPWAEAK